MTMFGICFLGPFSRFNDEKIKCNYYDKKIKTRDYGNVQSHGQKESKLNSTINTSGGHMFTHGKILKSPFNKDNVLSIKSK